MYEQELKHLEKFEELVQKYKVRPTLLQPLWSFFGFSAGYISALVNKESAMALTVAVETEIGEHYNNQLRDLIELAPEENELRKIVREFRDDELGHLDTAIKWDAEKAPFYKVLKNGVQLGTKTAIKIAEKI